MFIDTAGFGCHRFFIAKTLDYPCFPSAASVARSVARCHAVVRLRFRHRPRKAGVLGWSNFAHERHPPRGTLNRDRQVLIFHRTRKYPLGWQNGPLSHPGLLLTDVKPQTPIRSHTWNLRLPPVWWPKGTPRKAYTWPLSRASTGNPLRRPTRVRTTGCSSKDSLASRLNR